MKRKLHIHVYVGDAWQESKHPRAANGEFGSGSGSGSPKSPDASGLPYNSPEYRRYNALHGEAQRAAAAAEKMATGGGADIAKKYKEQAAASAEAAQEYLAAATSALAAKRQKTLEGAAAIAVMSADKRDNTHLGEFPGGPAAYDLYEARKMLPKAADKLKKITDDNSFSLWQSYEYIANIDGSHFGITKQEDPDEPDDDSKFVYSFDLLESADASPGVHTMISDKEELFKEMREHLKREREKNA